MNAHNVITATHLGKCDFTLHHSEISALHFLTYLFYGDVGHQSSPPGVLLLS